MIVYPVCSSSKGNCIYIQGDSKKAILIDLGVGIKTLKLLLKHAGFSLNSVEAVFLTHEHSDHVAGLSSFVKEFNYIPIFSSKQTLDRLIEKGLLSFSSNIFTVKLEKIRVADLNVSSFVVSHDCFCLAFCVECGAKKVSICTDLGCVTPSVLNNLRDSNLVFLESNFDVNMLRKGRYPYFLKKRIVSKYGHLSNDEAANLICWLVGNGVRRFLLGHLSQNNNLPELAKETVISSLSQFNFKYSEDYFVEVAPVRNSGKFYLV